MSNDESAPATAAINIGPSRALYRCLAVDAIAILLASTSPVEPDPGWMLFLVPASSLCTAWWLFAFIRAMIQVMRGTGTQRRLVVLPWLLPVSLPWIALLLAVQMVPAKARFLIARPALDRFAAQLVAGAANRAVDSDRIAGYRVRTISRNGPMIRLDLDLSFMSGFGLDSAVLLYSPDPPPSRDSVQDRVYDLTHLGGPWYSAWIDF